MSKTKKETTTASRQYASAKLRDEVTSRNISKYSSDPDARYGAKSKNDIWLGYKRHVGVDMFQGLISKVAVTPANVHDGAALKHVRPDKGAVVADKIYSDGKAQREMKARSLHSMAIKKNSAKDKNKRKDAFISALRMPYEGVFSKMEKRARYRGKVKVYFQAIMQALVHNTRQRSCVTKSRARFVMKQFRFTE